MDSIFARSMALALSGLGALACSSPDWVGTEPGDAPTGPTYYADVAPILQRTCVGCHREGAIGQFSLGDVEHATAFAALIAEATASRAMPPWGAWETDECKPRYGFKDDVRLTDEEIATLGAWAEAGAPAGDPADAPEPVDPPVDGLPGAELELELPSAYVTEGLSDEFPCFVIDPGFDEPTFINGTHVIPGNPEVVHHAVVVVDPTGISESFAGPDGSFDCFGGVVMNIPDAVPLTVWLPGAEPQVLPEEVGMFAPAGSRIVVQMHYHPAGKENAPDRTRFQFRFNQTVPDYILVTVPIGNLPTPVIGGTGLHDGPNDGPAGPEFRIPAFASDHVEQMQLTWPELTAEGEPMPELSFYGAAAHMHYVGTKLRMEIDHADPPAGEPDSECLIEEPAWNFEWQRTYAYDAPLEDLPKIRGGDVVRLHCEYDNSPTNPFVMRALEEANLSSPVDVFLGEETLDEMCLALMPMLFKLPTE
jgi:hypothetical protein